MHSTYPPLKNPIKVDWQSPTMRSMKRVLRIEARRSPHGGTPETTIKLRLRGGPPRSRSLIAVSGVPPCGDFRASIRSTRFIARSSGLCQSTLIGFLSGGYVDIISAVLRSNRAFGSCDLGCTIRFTGIAL